MFNHLVSIFYPVYFIYSEILSSRFVNKLEDLSFFLIKSRSTSFQLYLFFLIITLYNFDSSSFFIIITYSTFQLYFFRIITYCVSFYNHSKFYISSLIYIFSIQLFTYFSIFIRSRIVFFIIILYSISIHLSTFSYFLPSHNPPKLLGSPIVSFIIIPYSISVKLFTYFLMLILLFTHFLDSFRPTTHPKIAWITHRLFKTTQIFYISSLIYIVSYISSVIYTFSHFLPNLNPPKNN